MKGSVSGEYHMYQIILTHSCDYLEKTSIKIKVATDEGKKAKLNMTLNNFSSYFKESVSVEYHMYQLIRYPNVIT